MIAPPSVTIDANTPECIAANSLAAALIRASREVSVLVMLPDDTEEVHNVNGIAHALQAVIQQARRAGSTDEAIFKALAVALGLYLDTQIMGFADQVALQLLRGGLLASEMRANAPVYDFKAGGRA